MHGEEREMGQSKEPLRTDYRQSATKTKQELSSM
jgi:hypothetical protein